MESKSKDEEDYWNISETKGFDFDGEKNTELYESRSRSDRNLFIDDNVSESSYELPRNELPLSLIISEHDLNMILEEQSLSDYPLPKNILPEEEVRILRRQVIQEKFHAPLVSQCITKLMFGKPCLLSPYKSLKEKEKLLDEAISSGNGDAILEVVLFLVRTLKKRHINNLLQSRPEAINHYINYLSMRLQITECTDLLTMLGRNLEAAMLQFQIAVQVTSNPETKKQKLKQIYNLYFSQPGANIFYSQMVANYINLLEWQSSIKYKLNNSLGNIIDSSVLKSLYYVSENYKWGETSSSSNQENPYKFSEIYKINPAQFEWITLNERAKTQAWRDIEVLFEKKAWLNLKSKTFSIHIPLEKVILQLFSLNAPAATLNFFLPHVDDLQKRLYLAKKVNANKSIVDSLVNLKDRNELEMLKNRLENGTEEYFYAEIALKNLNSKWKAESIKMTR